MIEFGVGGRGRGIDWIKWVGLGVLTGAELIASKEMEG